MLSRRIVNTRLQRRPPLLGSSADRGFERLEIGVVGRAGIRGLAPGVEGFVGLADGVLHRLVGDGAATRQEGQVLRLGG